MKTNRIGVAAIAFALAGCACVSPERAPTVAVDKFNPDVEVVNNVPVVPETLRFHRGEKGKITWHLKTKGYQFTTDGIKFDPSAAGEIVGCQRDRNPMKFTCDNKHVAEGQGRFFYYWVNVEDAQGNRFTKDPFVLND